MHELSEIFDKQREHIRKYQTEVITDLKKKKKYWMGSIVDCTR